MFCETTDREKQSFNNAHYEATRAAIFCAQGKVADGGSWDDFADGEAIILHFEDPRTGERGTGLNFDVGETGARILEAAAKNEDYRYLLRCWYDRCLENSDFEIVARDKVYFDNLKYIIDCVEAAKINWSDFDNVESVIDKFRDKRQGSKTLGKRVKIGAYGIEVLEKGITGRNHIAALKTLKSSLNID